MYERELTQGGSYQHHTCVDKFDDYDIDLYDYECNITPKNITSPHDYIHLTYQHKYGIDKNHHQLILSHTFYILSFCKLFLMTLTFTNSLI